MSVDTTAPAAVIEAVNISKSFGPVPVLFSVSMDVRPGEVHALIGENGAGKSTLMKILSGFHDPTSGQIRLDGKQTDLPPNGGAEKLGVVLIHQELNLAEQMTVEENVFLGRELKSNGFLDKAAMQATVRKYLDEIGLDISPTDRISDLTIAQKQMVEIVKAVSRNARILIMDEPTAVLTEEETQVFFRQVEKLKESGVGIVFVSHKLNEVKEIADRVTILRDGQWIDTRASSDLTPDMMAQMMVGRELSDLYPPMHEADVDAELVLEVQNLRAPSVNNVSFSLRKGEILGFSGLIGSGRTAVFEAICGLAPIEAGTIRLFGRDTGPTTVAQARDLGLAYLTKDRKEKGLLLDKKMRPNLTLFALPKFVRNFRLDSKAEEDALNRAIRRFDVRARDKEITVGKLSGGNQQKLLLAKIMECDPKIVIIDEPTRGIDVGTKQQIYHFIAALAAEGVSVVVISSEMPEIIGICHRVVVMREGHITGVLTGDHINENEIMRYAAGLKREELH
ncbi:probable sugar ABC transporter, ATP-binding protein [Stappia aggregata IAM 12614]|uniref:Probable sugar ABC transporter, ATP-binding protein n=1 Tax=Roseibium aggregatum (strain ATCC 25650 / DSM 13394 / JCM 20685 / NBRC 16684 / NCIMB 2208 / IAM 12614 / B1) TaxID=384765 RepID=A0P258_ROSAI|nr:sugar ABC transporter ATP-binding protein [Roseibium aggregatum]EAV40914.1 probable sugar ABC transporter, ATP-binding protein [Stappia aggregata IAM 12614] [Roseibium aggregatum IAM 12614]